MKKGIVVLAGCIFCLTALAQTNVFPTTGNVGIGTTTPIEKLHVVGKAKVEANYDGGNIGGTLLLSHPGKTANGLARDWVIYNMSGIYGNGLQFWAYDNLGCPTGLCNARFTIADNGNVGVGTTTPGAKLEVTGDVHVYSGNTDGGRMIWRGGTNGTQEFRARVAPDGHFAFFPGEGMPTTLALTQNGNVGIGTVYPQAKLAVNGDLFAKKIKVTLSGWSDYVFEKDYPLPSLAEVEKFIRQNNHLPGVPSAQEVISDGLDVGASQAVLLKKIEELTLYIIDQNKKIEQLEAANKQFKKLEEEVAAIRKLLVNK